MPDALSSLLSLSSNRTPTAYTPNIRRNSARTGALSSLLGLKDDGSVSQEDLESAYGDLQDEQAQQFAAKAQAEALPEQIKGEYGLQIAERNRDAARQEKEALFAQQEFMQRMRDDAAAERAQSSQAATAARSAASQQAVADRASATQAAQLQRQRLGDLFKQRTAAQKQADAVGAFGRLFNRDKPYKDQVASLNQQIQSIGSTAEAGADFSPEEAAQALAAKFPNATLEDLMGRAEFDSPEEADAFQQALVAMGYR